MPKSLLERCHPDSITEFRAAARQRSQDALALAAADRRTGAIYLWGYSAEMTLKAAYFAVFGFTETQTISVTDLRDARTYALNTLGISWAGNFHNVTAWAELLVSFRASIPGLSYAEPGFGNTVVSQAQRIHSLWRETLRYHKNIAYQYELGQIQFAAE